jgi:hypothetical protein
MADDVEWIHRCALMWGMSSSFHESTYEPVRIEPLEPLDLIQHFTVFLSISLFSVLQHCFPSNLASSLNPSKCLPRNLAESFQSGEKYITLSMPDSPHCQRINYTSINPSRKRKLR